MPVSVVEGKLPEDDIIDEEEYDEEADDDFDDDNPEERSVSSSAEDDDDSLRKREKNKKPISNPTQLTEDLDSGDEATIKERQKIRKKQKRNKDAQLSSDEEDVEGWRAKTRSMRANETVQRQTKAKASIQKSTIDVNRIWEEMNKPGALPPVHVEAPADSLLSPRKQASSQDSRQAGINSGSLDEETVTIRRQFKFAGEVHVEEKVVPKSSAEAKLWLAQQEHNKKSSKPENDTVQRPLRKVSRFDPNYSTIDTFRNASIKAQPSALTGPKLNVVEKSKMDWASHVDAEGLKDELDVHAKAKDAYLNRMDFLQDVERRKEDEAKLARQKKT